MAASSNSGGPLITLVEAVGVAAIVILGASKDALLRSRLAGFEAALIEALGDANVVVTTGADAANVFAANIESCGADADGEAGDGGEEGGELHLD